MTLPRKRKGPPRRTTSPRCKIQRCSKRVQDLDMCASHLRARADREYSRWFREAYGQEGCWKCGSMERLQWCHVHSRRYMAVRWNWKNAVVLCASDHAYFTHHPVEWEQWCRDNGVLWDSMRLEAIHGTPMDPVEVLMQIGRAR